MRTLAEFVNQLVYHPATPETAPKHDELRTAIKGLGERLWSLIPDGPEKTLALRKLQEAQMWGNLAIALTAEALEGPDAAVARVMPTEFETNPVAVLATDMVTQGETVPAMHPADVNPPLDPQTAAGYIQGGSCFGPIAISESATPGLLTAVCYHGLCDWKSDRIEPGTQNLKALQLEHDDAASTLLI